MSFVGKSSEERPQPRSCLCAGGETHLICMLKQPSWLKTVMVSCRQPNFKFIHYEKCLIIRKKSTRKCWLLNGLWDAALIIYETICRRGDALTYCVDQMAYRLSFHWITLDTSFHAHLIKYKMSMTRQTLILLLLSSWGGKTLAFI